MATSNVGIGGAEGTGAVGTVVSCDSRVLPEVCAGGCSCTVSSSSSSGFSITYKNYLVIQLSVHSSIHSYLNTV